MLRTLMLILLTSLVVEADRQELDSTKMAQIHLLITDGWGIAVPDAMVRITPLGGWGQSRRMRYPKDTRIAVAPGKYVISVDAKGFRDHVAVYELSSGKRFLTVSLVLADIEAPQPDFRPSLRGRVGKSLLNNPPFWIRLVGITAEELRNVELEDTGRFEVHDLLPGRYMLLVMNGGAVKDYRIVEVGRIPEEIAIGLQEASEEIINRK